MIDNKKVKICFIDFYAYALFNPESKIVFGGSQVQLFLLAKELALKENFEVFFLTDDQSGGEAETHHYIEVRKFLRSTPVSRGPIGAILYLLSKLPQLKYLPSFISFFKALKDVDADIYVQRAAGAETGIIALSSKILQKKFVYMVAHESDVSGEFIKNNGYRGKLFNLGLKLADKIICQNQEQFDFLSKDLQKKSLIIKSAYPIEAINNTNKDTILWVGRSENWKRPELFLKLAKDFPKESFTMILTPADANKYLFDSISEEAKTLQNLKFIPGVPFEDVDPYFKQAKLFINTSEKEGFPNTFVQATKNGAPLASLNVNPDNIINRFDIGVFAKNNYEKLRLGIKQLLENKKIGLISKNAFYYAKENHNIEKISNQYEKLFSSISPGRIKKILTRHSRQIIAATLIGIGIYLSIPTATFFLANDPEIQNSVIEDLYGGYIANHESIIKNDGFEMGQYGLYLSPQKSGELIYKFDFKKPTTQWAWLYLGFNGMQPTPGKVSISKDNIDYVTLLENTYVNHLETKLDVAPYIQGQKSFYLKIEAINQNIENTQSSTPSISQIRKSESLNPPVQILYKLVLKIFSDQPATPPSQARVAAGFLFFTLGISLLFYKFLKLSPILLILSEAIYLSWYYFSKIIYTRLDADAIGYKNYAEAMTFNIFHNNGFYAGNFNEREPFYVFVTKLFFSIFGNSETHIRLLSFSLYIFSIYLLYLITKKLLGKIPGLLAALTMTFNIPLIIDSSRGMRLELEIVLILSLIWLLFCHDWKSYRYKFFITAGIIGGLIILTRSINLFGVMALIAVASITRTETLFSALKFFIISILITISLYIPHKYGMYKIHGDHNWDVNVNMRWNANVEFADKPGFPTKEENGKNPYAGPQITANEYFFELHSFKDLALGMIKGCFKVLKNLDLIGYPWLAEKYLKIPNIGGIDALFQIAGILGMVIIVIFKRKFIWISLAIPAFLTPSAFFYDKNLIEQYRHTFQVFPIFSLAAIFFMSAIFNKTIHKTASLLKGYEIVIRKGGKEKIISFKD